MTVHDTSINQRDRWVAKWLFSVAFMVFLMVVLGGVTRLTDSGLSIVEWRPFTGWLPPFSDAEWNRIFEKYQQTPEFLKINTHMTALEFKGIFWLEFLHRLWGRVIGVAFFVPFLVFLVLGWVGGRRALSLAGLLVLGGVQGGLGWYMVKSGLVDRPDVSQYRLAAHLLLAMALFSWLLWLGLRYWHGPTVYQHGLRHLCYFSRCAVILVFLTAFSGALVAGLDAGLSYNTFPLMDGEVVPDGLFDLQPLHLNFFENHITVQFDHRLLAMVTFAFILWFWVSTLRATVAAPWKRRMSWFAAMVCLQAGLGITTLLLVVPLIFAALHQAGAIVLLGLATWVAFDMQNPCRAYRIKSS